MDNKTIPYIAYELEQAKHERTVKRLITALIVAVILVFATNIVWIVMMSGYDVASEASEVTLDGSEGIANYIGRDGGINNG